MNARQRIARLTDRATPAQDSLTAQRIDVIRELLAAADPATLASFAEAGPAQRARIVGRLAYQANRGQLKGFRGQL